MRFIFIARVVIPLSTFEISLLAHQHLDILSHLLGYLNKGQNPSERIELKTCFLLYYKIKTYKVPNFAVLQTWLCQFLSFLNCISITVYFWPVNYLERVISNIFTKKTGAREKWEISFKDYFNGKEVVWVLSFSSTLSNL